MRESVSGKVELLTQMIEELQIEIDEEGHGEEELLDQLSKLEGSIEERNDELSAAQGTLNTLIEDRAAAASEINKRRARLVEIAELTKRFALLDDHYATDLKRLESIREAGSLFVHSDRKVCPLCGSNPEDQHLDSDCDGNVEAVLQAAIAEMEKIKKLQSELQDTVATLQGERHRINSELPEYSTRYATLEGELSDIASDLPPEAPSFITRVCGFGFHIRRRCFGQARRALNPLIAQACGALLRAFDFRVMSAA